jgi:hypothetical protein
VLLDVGSDFPFANHLEKFARAITTPLSARLKASRDLSRAEPYSFVLSSFLPSLSLVGLLQSEWGCCFAVPNKRRAKILSRPGTKFNCACTVKQNGLKLPSGKALSAIVECPNARFTDPVDEARQLNFESFVVLFQDQIVNFLHHVH